MGNLSSRVQKAKQIERWLKTNTTSGKGVAYCIWTQDGKHQYQTELFPSKKIQVTFGDESLDTYEFRCKCKRYNGGIGDCPGNSYHTICYHILFSLIKEFKAVDMQISFYESVFDATRALSFGGSLAKIMSIQGKGIVWAIIRKKVNSQLPKEEEKTDEINNDIDYLGSPITTSFEGRVSLMRGSREDEGID